MLLEATSYLKISTYQIHPRVVTSFLKITISLPTRRDVPQDDVTSKEINICQVTRCNALRDAHTRLRGL